MWKAVVTVATLLLVLPAAGVRGLEQAQSPLDHLSDAEFWSLITDAQELGGAFHSDNFTSNEPNFAQVAATLAKSDPHGGAYLGVGPEQNFHYIAAIKPAIAVIFDIRRQAIMQHLLFKALFEMSDTRADFMARLFSLPVPSGVNRTAPIDSIWQRIGSAPSTDRTRFAENTAAVEARLTRTHGFTLSDDDIKSLEYVYDAFFRLGPVINYAGDKAGLTTGDTNFMKLTAATDDEGVPRSFLGNDELYQFVKSLEARNLVVPIQADFAGPKSLRAVGDFLRSHRLIVSAFYISNVEQYLFHPQMPAAPGGMEINGGWRAFYDNLAALPADNATVLLRVPAKSIQPGTQIRRTLPDGTVRIEARVATTVCQLKGFLADVQAGKITTQADATACGR